MISLCLEKTDFILWTKLNDIRLFFDLVFITLPLHQKRKICFQRMACSLLMPIHPYYLSSHRIHFLAISL